MRPALLALTIPPLLSCCKPRDTPTTALAENQPTTPAASRELLDNFPLLPMVEKSLWSQLLEAEGKLAASPTSAREEASKEVIRITDKLWARHPFKAEDGRLELGGIMYDKANGRFSLPAQVEYPDPGDERHPGEVEMLLCTEGGRRHETLFVCKARPLHLELLMHLAGHAKGSRFRIEVLTNDGTRIPVDSLVRATGGEALESPLLWEFSGSGYRDLYSPDLSGDFAIFWHAHDSVLRVAHEEIASGVVKLAPVPHPGLKNDDPVVLEMVIVKTER
jgi:hypothetical protein